MSVDIIMCNNIGCSGTTECHVKETDDGRFEARMGFALMGFTNMNEKDFEACDYNPFHEKFYDNYVSGFGVTKELAIEEMKNELTNISRELWDFDTL